MYLLVLHRYYVGYHMHFSQCVYDSNLRFTKAGINILELISAFTIRFDATRFVLFLTFDEPPRYALRYIIASEVLPTISFSLGWSRSQATAIGVLFPVEIVESFEFSQKFR